jgi:hypothetical protein
VSKSGSSTDQSRGSQGQTRPMGKSSADGEKKPDVERNPEEVTTDQKNVPGAKIETRTEVRISSRQPQNQTVKFPKPDHPVSVTPS